MLPKQAQTQEGRCFGNDRFDRHWRARVRVQRNQFNDCGYKLGLHKAGEMRGVLETRDIGREHPR